MRESRTYGSVRGALSNERPYRDISGPSCTRVGTWTAGIPRALRQSAELGGLKVRAERDRNSHGDLQIGDRHREPYRCPPGKPPHESIKLRLGMSCPPGGA